MYARTTSKPLAKAWYKLASLNSKLVNKESRTPAYFDSGETFYLGFDGKAFVTGTNEVHFDKYYNNANGGLVDVDKIYDAIEDKPVKIKISNDYTAAIVNGVTTVGCQTIPFNLLEEIYLAAKASK